MQTHKINTPSTIALFYDSSLECKSNLHSILSFTEGLYLFFTDSPFHPEDFPNGDQPGDIGFIELEGYKFKVVDSRTFVSDSLTGDIVRPESKSLLRKGVSQGHYLLHTGHFILHDGSKNFEKLSDTSIGKECVLSVDKDYRNLLNKLHTATHIMSLALSKTLKLFWSKDAENKDGLGNPDFDFYALQSSKIFSDKVVDIYRIGKSLKKAGFKSDVFESTNIDDISKEITNTANQIISDNFNSEVEMKGDSIILGSMRVWSTKLYDKIVSIPCGGTHVKNLGELSKITITASYNKTEGLLTIETFVKN